MAKANFNQLSIIRDYGEAMRIRKVSKVALLMVQNGKPYACIYSMESIQARIERDICQLVQVHDGVRLGKFEFKNGGRNLSVLSLFRAAECHIPVPTKQGDAIFEKAVARAVGGRYIGGLKHHPCDVVLRDGTRIECKGLMGAWHAEYDANGKLISSVEKKQTGEDYMSQLLANWDAYDDSDFND